MTSAKEAVDRLCAPEHQVSAHYLIAEDGIVYDLVDDSQRAWHAGAGTWRGCDDVNSHSIGIELANDGASPFAEPLMVALEKLLSDLMRRHDIPPQAVIGHSDMAPDRKKDPGRRFDWRRLALQGLVVWPKFSESAPVDEVGFCSHLHRFGYPDAPMLVLLDAFRQRFRPYANGPLDGWDMAIAKDLADRFSVDQGAASA